MATLVISHLQDYGNFKSPTSTHKGHSLQGRRSPVNNSNQRRNSTSSHSPKAVSPPHRQQEPLSPSFHKSSNADPTRKLERAMSEPSDRRAASAQSNSSRYKTELCRPFEESGTCKYGDKCQFAHGAKELRNLIRHPKYKTELCRSFHMTGLCPYGSRCHFIHKSQDEIESIMSNLQISGSAPLVVRPVTRPKALPCSSLGSSGESSPNSSTSGSPPYSSTSTSPRLPSSSSSDDLFQINPNPTAFPFPPPPELPSSPAGNIIHGYLDFPAHDTFNVDYFDSPNIFSDGLLSRVFGSASSSDGLEVDPSNLCGSPPLEFSQPPTPTSLENSPAFGAFRQAFMLFGKHDL